MTNVGGKLYTNGKQENVCNICVRSMERNEKDCQFVAELKVQAKQREYIHATSRGSLDTIRRVLARNHEEQDDWFYSRHFIIECNGEPAGMLALAFPGDPKPIESDYEMDFGCTDLCGLACLKCGIDETVGELEGYITIMYVLEHYMHLGLEQLLLQKAEQEARHFNKEKLFLYVPFGCPVKQFYTENGFQVVDKTCCCVWCAMGHCGFYRLEKRFETEQSTLIVEQPS